MPIWQMTHDEIADLNYLLFLARVDADLAKPTTTWKQQLHDWGQTGGLGVRQEPVRQGRQATAAELAAARATKQQCLDSLNPQPRTYWTKVDGEWVQREHRYHTTEYTFWKKQGEERSLGKTAGVTHDNPRPVRLSNVANCEETGYVDDHMVYFDPDHDCPMLRPEGRGDLDW